MIFGVNFSRIRVMVVEDNTFIRTILMDILRNIGITNIVPAQKGIEAIELLKVAKRQNTLPDIIISDLVMREGNGLVLLRWLRNSSASPNRFMPFIMLSGAADNRYVAAARDLGANEFIAKPFSVSSIINKILNVINYPRPFVMVKKYFGPDRRRRKKPLRKKEKRQTSNKDILWIYSEEQLKTKSAKELNSKVCMFQFPNSLKEKISGNSKEPITIEGEILETLEEDLKRQAVSFKDWAIDYLEQLSKLSADAAMNKIERASIFKDINLLALELRGQGGVFGYPIITVVGRMLFEVTEANTSNIDDSTVEVIKAHIDSMRAVLREDITGDGGVIGRELIENLKKTIMILKNKTKSN